MAGFEPGRVGSAGQPRCHSRPPGSTAPRGPGPRVAPRIRVDPVPRSSVEGGRQIGISVNGGRVGARNAYLWMLSWAARRRLGGPSDISLARKPGEWLFHGADSRALPRPLSRKTLSLSTRDANKDFFFKQTGSAYGGRAGGGAGAGHEAGR